MAKESQKSIPSTNTAISPMKNGKRKYIVLFGTKIWTHEEFDETEILHDAPISLAKRSRTSSNANLEVTCRPRDKEPSESEKEEENQTEVPTEQPNYTWTIKKLLTKSDINELSRLLLEKPIAEKHIMPHLSADDQATVQEDSEGLKVRVYDHDTNTEHNLVFKRMKSTGSYVFNGRWVKDFVKRRELKQGDEVGLFWGSDDQRLNFSIRSRAFFV